MNNYYYETGINWVLTFTKPGITNFYYKIKKDKNSHFLNFAPICAGDMLKIKNLKYDEGMIHFIIILLLIIGGGFTLIGIVTVSIRNLYINSQLQGPLPDEEENKKGNDQVQQPISVSVKNEEQQNNKTTQDKNKLSLNNPKDNNKNELIPTIYETEKEIITTKENLPNKN